VTTYLADDSGIETSQPIEVFSFTKPDAALATFIARSTSWSHDVDVAGLTYTKRTISRGAVAIMNPATNMEEMQVTVTRLDPAAVYYMGHAVPPQNMLCVITRVQTGGTTKQIFSGYINDCRQVGNKVVFTIAQSTDDTLATQIPTVTITRRCPHTLFDSMCQIPRAGNFVSTTITSIVGRTITVASIAGFVEANFTEGELWHPGFGEHRWITKGYGTRTFDLDVRLASNVVVGDGVALYIGCDKFLATCRSTFNNVVNFGGAPHIKTTDNPYIGVAADLNHLG
jgi:Phage conserved hypothetical protein BR0599